MNLPITTLALSDGVEIWMFIGQMIFNIIAALFLLRVKQREEKVDQLEAEIKQHTAQMVEQKIQQSNAQLKSDIRELTSTTKGIILRLDRGSNKLEDAVERDHQLDLKIAGAFGQVKDIIHKVCASKETVQQQDEKLGRMDRRLSNLEGQNN